MIQVTNVSNEREGILTYFIKWELLFHKKIQTRILQEEQTWSSQEMEKSISLKSAPRKLGIKGKFSSW